jgi:hypothetical protein
MFIDNLIHKCESVLLDQLEFYQFQGNSSVNKKLLIERYSRIYGSKHKSIKQLNELRGTRVLLKEIESGENKNWLK